jgi:TatD DNase family protein
MLETDSPWCDIRTSHAAFNFIKTHLPSKDKKKWQIDNSVKGRNEPHNIIHVLEIISKIKQISSLQLSDIIYQNTLNVFFKNIDIN